ncbi:MAG: hypothetical protein QOJ85_4224, partial [Solirubrobacteraceae bacterium]|nr:hypothetical protein [Solirubrobacteraceae bacterium]
TYLVDAGAEIGLILALAIARQSNTSAARSSC